MRVRIGGRVVEAELRREIDRVVVRVDGRDKVVPYSREGGLVLEVDGRQVRAWASGDTVVVDGRTRTIARVASAAAVDLPPEVTPPMPAVVVRVSVNVGDTVERGQALVVVSAMKTELTLRAPRAGVVTAVRAAVGQNVRPGEKLVEVG